MLYCLISCLSVMEKTISGSVMVRFPAMALVELFALSMKPFTTENPY